ncbi:eukaryotic cytochrome b561-domain-containing protein [Syncephalastrum racemosum]|uniref:Eukaryotic cytochrome b561-domain-containing protein n=1 Tax=Syncephalastrum racemosum TaxID=13706 RepID=A0A1X2H9Y9_SYNRA|nr:eukaryotic cytochrome b561-domain-containing protein [Syncephalastrum racemosum]
MAGQQEQMPLLPDIPSRRPFDALSMLSVRLGLLLFAALVLSVLARVPLSVFSYHPFFMTLFIVLFTEGIALLQPTSTAIEKQRGLRRHAIVQGAAITAAILGVSAIFYNKVISNKDHFTSAHGQLGLFVILFLISQVVFGLLVGYTTPAAKRYWKYHRITGYTLTIIAWLTAELGVRADYVYNNMAFEGLIWFHWVALILIILGISYRVRLSKWGIRVTQA